MSPFDKTWLIGPETHETRYNKMNIPTKITVSRIALIVAMFIAMIVVDGLAMSGVINLSSFVIDCGNGLYIGGFYLILCIVFIVASFTDFLDGYLARKWHQVTDLGKFLDPVADKLLINVTFIYLCIGHGQPALDIPFFVYVVILMVARDIVVDALRFIAAGKGKVLAANIFGKIKTVCQMVAIPLVLLNGFPFAYFDGGWITRIVVYATAFASLLSGVIYVAQNLDVFKEGKHE